MVCDNLIQLLESDVVGVLSEALTAHVQVVLPAKSKTKSNIFSQMNYNIFVLPDETVLVTASSAASGALSVLSWTAEPNILVTHGE